MSIQDSVGQGRDSAASLRVSRSSALEQTREQDGPLVKLMARRETHSSRAVASTVLALVLILLVVWLGTELVLSALGKAPLLVSGESLFVSFFSVADLLTPALGIIAGGLLALTGLFLLVLAVAPGALRRHSTQAGRFAFVADDKVIASAVSAAVRQHAGLTSDQVMTRVSARQVLVTITPMSGHRVDAQELTAFAQATIDAYTFTPALKARVQVEKQGVISNG